LSNNNFEERTLYLYYKKEADKQILPSNKKIAELSQKMTPVKNNQKIKPYRCLHVLNPDDDIQSELENIDDIQLHEVSVERLAKLDKRCPKLINRIKHFPFSSAEQFKKSVLAKRKVLNIGLVDTTSLGAKELELSLMLLKSISVLTELCAKFGVASVSQLFSHDYLISLQASRNKSKEVDFEHYLGQFGIANLFSLEEQKIMLDDNLIEGPERHLLIIWEHALPGLDLLRGEIENSVTVIGEHWIDWPDDRVDDNMLRFYNQPKHIIEGKIKRVGRGKCLLLIVEDKEPQYDFRQTSRSVEYVNKKLFDLKDRLRKISVDDKRIPQRWPDLIHSTNSTREYRHDFILLFGFSADEYDQKVARKKEYNITYSLIGADGWESFEQLFECMNDCLDYVIMRNWDGLPDQATIKGHDDIDFLVDSLASAMRILKAKKVFPRPYRVHCEIMVAGRPIRIDLRAVGDEYYPKEMQQRMLKNRVLEKCFYVPNEEDHFYSLAYHAMIHKEAIGRLFELLADYMRANNWEFTQPEPSVRYNRKHIFLSSLTHKESDSNTSVLSLTDQCLIDKKPIGYTKFGILNREIKWLEKMKGWNRVPALIDYDKQSLTFDYAGQPLTRKNMPKNYRQQIEDIIKGLKKFGCSHNDIWSENLLVDKGIIKLIDFQWATKIGDPIPQEWPPYIGETCRFGDHNFIDEYSIWLSIKKILEGRAGRGQ